MNTFGGSDPSDLGEVQRLLQRLNSRQVPAPQARVFNSANISVANGSRVALTFNSERYDNGGLHSTSANTSRLTAPITGLYQFGACAQFASNATGTRQIELQLNGTTLLAINNKTALNGAVTISSISGEYQLAAGHYIEVTVVQTSGGALNVEASASYSPEFWMHRVAGYVNQGV